MDDPTIQTGERTAGAILTNNATRRPFDISEKIHLLDANKAPLLLISKGGMGSGGVQKERVTDQQFKHQKDQFLPIQVTIPAAQAAALTTSTTGNITPPSGEHNYVGVGDVLQIPASEYHGGPTAGTADELWLVTSVTTSTGVFAISRPFGSNTSAIDMTGQDEDITAYRIGTVKEEGWTAGEARSTYTQWVTNYIQTFSSVVEVSEELNLTKLYGAATPGSERKRLQVKKMKEHLEDIERAFIAGQKKKTTLNSKDVYATSGLEEQLTSNVTEVNGTVNFSNFQTIMKNLFAYGDATTRFFVCGGTIISALSLMAEAKLQTMIGDTVYGMKVSKIVTGFGELVVVHDKLMDRMGRAGNGFLISPGELKYAYMTDTVLKQGIQSDEQHVLKDEIYTRCGLKVVMEEHCGQVLGVTGYSAT